ncbi:NADH-quinone oxidoreductase subunit K, partial [Salmonella enterica subsp. enterica serovar Anatum]|nr:NADH-quinone oxidoreductase subunit K [Salmonella enterica subsp. enterica serovar Anatum]
MTTQRLSLTLAQLTAKSAVIPVMTRQFWKSASFRSDGQVMYILAISLAAAEASIGLALLLQLHRRRQNLNIDSVSE